MRTRLCMDDFLKRSTDRHGDRYDYSSVEFRTSKDKVEIICTKHGNFFQLVESHWNGSGCAKCSYEYRAGLPRKKSQEEFLESSKRVHGNRYDYSLVEYAGVRSYLKIICTKHGEFKQMASNHLAGHGCKKCVLNKSVSKVETKWLDLMGIDTAFRQYPIQCGKRVVYVDGFHAESNTVFEFYGDFWHGNPYTQDLDKINPFVSKSFKCLLNRTLDREQMLLELGYSLCFIWEDDFLEGNPPVYTKKMIQ